MKNNASKQFTHKAPRDYSYYSNTLKTPFDSLEELREAEAAYQAKIVEKENKAATKKADAKKVEDAFRAMNAARRDYKDSMIKLTDLFQESMKKLKDAYEIDKNEAHTALANAENAYKAALKEFTDKYPEGYHLTLKDGDFETTISGRATTSRAAEDAARVSDIIDWLFRGL